MADAEVSKQTQYAVVISPSAKVSKQTQYAVSAQPAAKVSKQTQYFVSGAPVPPSSAFPSRDIANRLRTFKNPPSFAGRRGKLVAKAAAPLPPPPVQQLPSGGLQRRLRAYAAHFTPPAYKGRSGPRFYFGGGVGNPPRASQYALETLTFNLPGSSSPVRAGQIVAESLTIARPGPGMRAGQFVAETICSPSTVTHAGQIVVEALVPYLESLVIPVYPELPGLTINVVKRPKWSTGKGVGSSGREVTVAYWGKPQWEWDLEYSALNDQGQYYQALAGADIKSLIGFTLDRMGSQAPFYFRDADDYTQVGAELGTGDGGTAAFLFSRTYGAGGFDGTEPVGAVNTGAALNVYLNGVLQTSGYTINTATPCGNFVQFTTPPAAGVVVTADFSFYYFCRFKDDSYDFTKFLSNMWTAKVSLFSLKN